jgi:hypothetical protein
MHVLMFIAVMTALFVCDNMYNSHMKRDAIIEKIRADTLIEKNCREHFRLDSKTGKIVNKRTDLDDDYKAIQQI